ncbi:hypothetical protein J7L49_00270 [Candidatus Bathyarchaeota archaeon]|nr:hypothetical protein [Candidatus Bathyarchaeota archaeon]
MMTKCEYCGKEVDLPFKCPFCGHLFCIEHRLPEKHNCPDAPPRTPLGSYQTKLMLAEYARRKETEIEKRNVYVPSYKTETLTYGNIHGHEFMVPVEVYSDKKYREKLDKARTLKEVERILRDYRKHHKKNK